jgi:hypothetical protein
VSPPLQATAAPQGLLLAAAPGGLAFRDTRSGQATKRRDVDARNAGSESCGGPRPCLYRSARSSRNVVISATS